MPDLPQLSLEITRTHRDIEIALQDVATAYNRLLDEHNELYTSVEILRTSVASASNSVQQSLAWKEISDKPTTVKDFGLTDVYTKQEVDKKTKLPYLDTLPGTLSASKLSGSANLNALSLAGNLTIGGTLIIDSTLVSNLNAEYLAGHDTSFYRSRSNHTGTQPFSTLSGALAFSQLPTGLSGTWDIGTGNTLNLAQRLQISALVGIGVAPTSSTGFNCRPGFMSGAAQIGATYSPQWSVTALTRAVGLNAGGVGAASATPYTTADMTIVDIVAPTRGANQTITLLRGISIANLMTVTAGTRYAIDATQSIRADYTSTADELRLLVWDVTAGSLKRFSRGAPDSAGVGFRLVCIPN